MGKTTEVLEFLVTSQTASAVQGFHSVGTAADGVKSKLTETESSFGKLKGTATNALAGIGVSASTLAIGAGAAIGGFAVKAISDFQSSAQAVLHFKEVAGGTSESASRWVETFNDYGVSADTAATLVGKLAKNAETSPASLEAYGASVIHAKDGTIDLNGTLLNVIDTMHNAPDEASRAALGTAAFGRGWQDMAKLVDVGASTIKTDFDSISKAQIFSDKDLQNSENFRLALDDLSDALAGVENKIGEAVIPVLTDLIGTLKNVGEAAGLVPEPLRKIGEIAAKFNPIALPFTAAKYALDALSGSADHSVTALGPINPTTQKVAGSIADLKAQTDLQNAALKEAAAQYDATNKAIEAFGKAAGAQVDSMRAADDSQFAANKSAQDLATTFEELPAKIDAISASGKSAAEITRETQQAFGDAAQAAVGMADSQVRLDKDTQAASGATQSHTGALDVWNAAILTSAASTDGALHAAIVNHIAAVNGIPPEKVTEILATTPNIDEQKQKIDEASAARKLTITADANTDPAQRAVDSFIASQSRRSFSIDVTGRLLTGQVASGGSASGLNELGEEGRELVRYPSGAMELVGHSYRVLPAGSFVFNNPQTEAMLRPHFAGHMADGGNVDPASPWATWMPPSGPGVNPMSLTSVPYGFPDSYFTNDYFNSVYGPGTTHTSPSPYGPLQLSAATPTSSGIFDAIHNVAGGGWTGEGRSSGDTVNVYITVTDLDPDQVMASVEKWRRRNGKRPWMAA